MLKEEEHNRIKVNIENSHKNFERNYRRFTEMRNFVFVTTISDNEKTVLQELQKPVVEFNILEAYVSRLCGEFSKSEPSIKVACKDGDELRIGDEQVPYSLQAKTVEVVESYLRYLLKEANKQGLEYQVYRDTLSGGFSAIKVYVEYNGERSFHHEIKMKRVFDPTLVGFDPLAMEADKGDGQYCFEIVPYRLDDFKKKFPKADTDSMSFAGTSLDGNVGNFNWSFKSGKDKIILVADYYEKEYVKEEIMRLSDGRVVTKSEYKKIIKEWDEFTSMELRPIPVGNSRMTEILKIVRYNITEKQILSTEPTDYKRLPIIFIDGNSIIGKENNSGPMVQMTRPYIYQAVGAQKLKNLAGQSLANELENMGPEKIIASIEGLNDKYLEGYINPQKARVIMFNHLLDGDPSVQLPPPVPIPRAQIPAEITNAFMGADAIVQNVLGAFDASMSKLNENEMSGIAIQEMATMSNAAAMPYIVNYLRGLQSAAQMAVDLIPLYYTTPRTIPVLSPDGRHNYALINQDGGISFDYDNQALNVSIEAGVNFNVQQSRALNQIIALSRAMPSLGEFFNEAGTDILLDNVEIRNVETLRDRSEAWMQQQKQMKQQAMQAAQSQPNMEQQALKVAQQQVQSEHQVGMAKVQLQAASEQAKTELKLRELSLETERNRVDMAKIQADIQIALAKLGIEQQKVNNSKVETLIDANLRTAEHQDSMRDKKLDRTIKSLEKLHTSSQKVEKQ